MGVEYVYQRELAELLSSLGFHRQDIQGADHVLFVHTFGHRFALPAAGNQMIPKSVIDGYRSSLLSWGLIDSISFDQWFRNSRKHLTTSA